ncbi:MAG: hypothetical protein ACK5K7_02940 [Bacilli bacterium]
MSLKLKIITPDIIQVNEETSEVMIGGYEGHFTIFSDHTPFVSRLKISTGYYVKNNNLYGFTIKGGFCSVDNNEVLVITSSYVEEKINKRTDVYDKTLELANMEREEVGKYFDRV